MNLVVDGGEGEGERSSGEDFSQAMTCTVCLFLRPRTSGLNCLQKVRQNRAAAHGYWKKGGKQNPLPTLQISSNAYSTKYLELGIGVRDT